MHTKPVANSVAFGCIFPKGLTALGLAFVVFSTYGCTKKEESPPKSPEAMAASDSSEHGVSVQKGEASEPAADWSYMGDNGPETWGGLSSDFRTCGRGRRQSPIDLSGTMRSKSVPIALAYRPSPVEIANTGHTIQLRFKDGGGVVLDSVRYDLQQVHFHTPSEHAVSGKRSAMEAHFVHKNPKGEFLVIAVMLELGAADPIMGPIWAALPPTPGDPRPIENSLLNPRDMMPQIESFYTYSGSLTTPPCREGVTWMVFDQPMTIAPEQSDAYTKLIGLSARPLQDRNHRDILHIGAGNAP